MSSARKLHWGSPVRRFLAIVALSAALALGAGCRMDVGVETAVEEDGSGTVRLRMEVDDELRGLLESQGTEQGLFDSLEQNLGSEWEVRSGAEEGGSRWLEASRPFARPSEIPFAGGGSGGILESVSLVQEDAFLRTFTDIEATFDPVGAMNEIGSQTPQDINPGLVASVVVLENRVSLPGRLTEHNGDRVDDGYVVWRPSLTEPTVMRASSVDYDWPLITALAAGLLAVIFGATAVLVMWWRTRV